MYKLLAVSAFPFEKTLNDFEFDFQPSLNKAHAENRLENKLKHYAKYKLLIIDEMGYCICQLNNPLFSN